MEWISVDERLPEEFVSVLGYMPDADPFPPVRECYRRGDVFVFPALHGIAHISHWREMPAPPCEIAESIESCTDCGFCEEEEHGIQK